MPALTSPCKPATLVHPQLQRPPLTQPYTHQPPPKMLPVLLLPDWEPMGGNRGAPIPASSVAGGTVGESQLEWEVGRDLGGSPLSHKKPGSQTGFRDAELFLQFTLPGVQFHRADGRGHGWVAHITKSSAFEAEAGTQ